MDRNKVYQLLRAHFDDGELRDLCFQLDIEYENLPGQGKKDKARELIAYCTRHACIKELLAACRQLRPALEWPADLDIYEPSERTPKAETQKQQGGVYIQGSNVNVGGDIVGGDKVVYGSTNHTNTEGSESS